MHHTCTYVCVYVTHVKTVCTREGREQFSAYKMHLNIWELAYCFIFA